MSDVVGDEPRVAREPDPDELHRERRAQIWKAVMQAALVAALVLVLGFSAWTLFLIRDTQVGNRTTLKQAKAAAESSKRTADRIEDCTSPSGACFQRAQRQTSGAVAGINTITVRATACLAVVLKQIPDGAQVPVDDVATKIQRCIQSSNTSVAPQRVVPGPRLVPKQPATTSSPDQPRKHHHPKGGGAPGVPTPTPSGGVLLDLQRLCDLLQLDPCLLTRR